MDRCVSGNLALEILETFTDECSLNYQSTNHENGNSLEKIKNYDKKLSKIASSFGFKTTRHELSKNQLRVHRHHLHSNHHIHLSSLKKNKLKRRSFKIKNPIKNSIKMISEIDNDSNTSFLQLKQETKNNEIPTTTLNMASQPLSKLKSTMSLNQKGVEKNDNYLSKKVDIGYFENLSYTNNQYLPFNMISARTSYSNNDIHVLLFDPDAIICTIRHLEETLKSMKNIRVAASNKYLMKSKFQEKSSHYSTNCDNISSSLNDSIIHSSNHVFESFSKSENNSHMKSCFKYLNLAVAPPDNIYDYSKYLAKHTYYHSEMIRQIIQLLISSLSGWGLDDKLDFVCKSRLDLSCPSRHICYGLISYGKLVAQLPHSSNHLIELNISSQNNSFSNSPSSIKHWESSKTMLTQHIMTIVSIATSLLLSDSTFLNDYIFSKNDTKEMKMLEMDVKKENNKIEKSRFSKKTISSDSNILLSYIKSGWSILANFYCYTINTHVFQCERFKFRGLILHELIRHWLSFNCNIREASQSILLSELTRLGFVQVSNLIQAWEFFLPDNIIHSDSIFGGSNYSAHEIDISYPEIQNALVIESGGTYGFWPTPAYHRAMLALYMIGFIICELFVAELSTEFNVSKCNYN